MNARLLPDNWRDYSAAELRDLQIESREHELWADREAFGEYIGDRFGPMDFRPRRERKTFTAAGLVGTGVYEPEITTGLRSIVLAQAWRAAKPEDRPAIAAKFGASLLSDLETYLADKARDDVEGGS